MEKIVSKRKSTQKRLNRNNQLHKDCYAEKDIEANEEVEKDFGLIIDDVIGPDYFVQDEFCSPY